jgi:Integrase zinc binding domain
MRGGYARDDLVLGTLVPTMNLRHDKLGFLWTADHRLVVPDADDLRFECFESVHSHPFAGHYGQARTLKKAEQLYDWPNMARNIAEWCSACDSCQRVKAETKRPAGHLKPLPVPGRRWESVSMDFITDLPMTSKGHDAIWWLLTDCPTWCTLSLYANPTLRIRWRVYIGTVYSDITVFLLTLFLTEILASLVSSGVN